MKTFALKVLLIGLSFLFLHSAQAQKMLDPTDTLVNYDSLHPPVQPPAGKIGKWVRTPSMDWNSSAYKAYIYQGSDFRLHFPQTYKTNDGKKYPIMVFYHGDGEEGLIYDNETTLRNGMLTFHKMEVQGVFNGYIIVMQNQFGWGTAQFINLQNLIDTLCQEYGGDPYRVIQNGLSGGGQGVWQQLVRNPTYFAASVPMSAALTQDATPADVNILKFTPIWNLDGGLDNDPPPFAAQLVASDYQSQGANYVYTNFPNNAHNTWDSTWAQPNFWPFVNSAYLSNPWPLFNRTIFCPGDPVKVTLGIVPGLDGYQWRRNDTVIAGAVTDSIVVTQAGTYDARVLRGSTWSDWSHIPVVISAGLPPLTFTVTQPTCTFGKGQILISAPPRDTLFYSLDGTNFKTKGEFDSLAPGIYHITIKNNVCAASVFTDTIKPQPVTPAKPNITVLQPSCTAPKASFTINVVDSSFTYSINNGHNYAKTSKFVNLPQGSYLVTAESTGGCVSSKDTVVIGAPVSVPATPSVSVTQPSCATPLGTITINTNAADSGLTYSINGSAYQTGTTFKNLAAGRYPVTAKNSTCPSSADTVTVNVAKTVPSAPTLKLVQPTCQTLTGTITVTAPLDTAQGALAYSINGSTYQPGPGFTAVNPGSYSVTVRNTSGCVSPSTAALINPQRSAPATPTVAVTQPTCSTPLGTITINTTAADSGLTYSINGTAYQTGTTFKNLQSGRYPVTAKNSTCTSAADTITITATKTVPSAPTLTLGQPTCSVTTGTITVTAPLATPQTVLAYSINGSIYQSAPGFASVNPGSYKVTVRNIGGCVSSPTTAVINPQPTAPATPTVAVTQPTCATGSGTITISPATPGLSYSINGTTYLPDNTFTNVTSGTYRITAESSPGCVSPAVTAVVNSFTGAPATPKIVVSQPSCTIATGSITITSPIDSGYTYRISDTSGFQSVPLFTGIPSGTYYVYAQGSGSGCLSAPATAVINSSPALPVPTVSVTQATCNISTGAITIMSPVDTGFLYSINGVNYQSDTVITPVSPGTYQVTVKNTAGCISAAAPAQILTPPPSCSSCAVATHSVVNGFLLSANPGYATTLWFNLHTRLTADQTAANGNYVKFSGGTLAFSGIMSSFDSTVSLPGGEIVVDNTVTTPSTTFNSTTNSWITKVPVGYQSEDVFVAGAAITSSNGYTLSGTTNATILSGSWTSDKALTSDWWYGMACYQPTFANAEVGSVNVGDGVPIGGHSTGTPNNQTGGLVYGGSGTGGSNFTGTYSPVESYTACVVPLPVPAKLEVTVYPNPYLSTSSVYFNITTSVSGTGSLEFYNLLGERLGIIEQTQFRAGVPQTITMPMIIGHKQPVIYVFQIGGKKVQGTLLPEK